jgi:hypothetical protein
MAGSVQEWVRFMRVNHRNPTETAPRDPRRRAKLTEDDIRTIRARAATSTIVGLAAEYGVSRATMSDIVNRRNWRGVE